MASELDHIELANRNQEALGYLLTEHEKYSEWVATVAFYKAIHVVEAMFAAEGKETTTSHEERRDRLKSDRRNQHIYKHYRHLWVASTVARYLHDSEGGDYRSFSDYMNPDKVCSEIVRHRLIEVEQSAGARLSRDLGSKLLRVGSP